MKSLKRLSIAQKMFLLLITVFMVVGFTITISSSMSAIRNLPYANYEVKVTTADNDYMWSYTSSPPKFTNVTLTGVTVHTITITEYNWPISTMVLKISNGSWNEVCDFTEGSGNVWVATFDVSQLSNSTYTFTYEASVSVGATQPTLQILTLCSYSVDYSGSTGPASTDYMMIAIVVVVAFLLLGGAKSR